MKFEYIQMCVDPEIGFEMFWKLQAEESWFGWQSQGQVVASVHDKNIQKWFRWLSYWRGQERYQDMITTLKAQMSKIGNV